MPLKTFTIRGVKPELPAALEQERLRRGTSMNETILSLLSAGLGLERNGAARSNGLARLAGGWTEEEFQEFERATAVFEEVDPELWR